MKVHFGSLIDIAMCPLLAVSSHSNPSVIDPKQTFKSGQILSAFFLSHLSDCDNHVQYETNHENKETQAEDRKCLFSGKDVFKS